MNCRHCHKPLRHRHRGKGILKTLYVHSADGLLHCRDDNDELMDTIAEPLLPAPPQGGAFAFGILSPMVYLVNRHRVLECGHHITYAGSLPQYMTEDQEWYTAEHFIECRHGCGMVKQIERLPLFLPECFTVCHKRLLEKLKSQSSFA